MYTHQKEKNNPEIMRFITASRIKIYKQHFKVQFPPLLSRSKRETMRKCQKIIHLLIQRVNGEPIKTINKEATEKQILLNLTTSYPILQGINQQKLTSQTQRINSIRNNLLSS